MRKISIKQRVTFFYSAVLISLVLLTMAFFIITIDLQIVNVSHTVLEKAVKNSFNYINTQADWLEIDPDFVFYVNDVTLVLYGPEGTLMIGTPPTDFPESLPLISDEHQSIATDTETWQVYDLYTEYPNKTGVWVRGIYSLSNSMSTLNNVLKIMAFAFPILTLLAILIGYIITSRAFEPIKKIRQTAEEITRSRDLSKRIALTSGTKDELYSLGHTFDVMFDRIESAFENEKNFTSDVSHELRTPISVIISQSEYGLSQPLNTEEYKSCLKAILAQGVEMSSLVTQLLELSRSSDAQNSLIKEPINLADLCETVAEELAERAEQRNIRIITKLDQEIIMMADQTQILRMVINLVSNAITYGKDGGFVMIDVHRESNVIRLIISDDGVGIAKEHLEKIFNRFYQVDTSRSNRYTTHSGLGLPMVKWVAEAHNGEVKVQSTLNVGSSFIVTFPYAADRHNDIFRESTDTKAQISHCSISKKLNRKLDKK